MKNQQRRKQNQQVPQAVLKQGLGCSGEELRTGFGASSPSAEPTDRCGGVRVAGGAWAGDAAGLPRARTHPGPRRPAARAPRASSSQGCSVEQRQNHQLLRRLSALRASLSPAGRAYHNL